MLTGPGGTYCVDSAVVAAALRGRVLVLEGLEKVERNVLPVLNNLLENREMQLEDGHCVHYPPQSPQRAQLAKTMRDENMHATTRRLWDLLTKGSSACGGYVTAIWWPCNRYMVAM